MAKQAKQKPIQTDPSVQLLGAIDIGSNSIRLIIGQLLPDGQIEVLEHAQQAVRLGQDSFRRGRLDRMVMQAAVSILRDFKRRLDMYQIKHIWTVATSAVREARNADVFLDRVLMATGLEVNVIDGPLEGRLTVSAVRSVMDAKAPSLGTHTLITEVGGGSTMLAVLEHGEIEASQSLGLGSIRLQEVLGTSGQPALQVADLIHHEIAAVLTTIESVMSFKDIQKVIAVGADIRFAAARVGKPMKNPNFSIIRRKAFDKLIEELKDLSIDQMVSQYDMPYADAETMLPALLIYQSLMHATKAKQIIVSSVSMRDGLLLELARHCRGEQDLSFAREVIQSALSIAEKYKVNLHHAKRVAACAVRLFDQLQQEHGLGPRFRVLLEVASLLHEVGTYVSTRAYHKHTQYLVANSEIYGLSSSGMAIVSNVARYHRRSVPKPTHPQYVALSQENRIAVNKLAALLRLAKAMDVSDIRNAHQITCKVKGNVLTLRVPGITDTVMQKRSLEVRSDFLEDVYGLKVEFKSK